MPRFHHIKAFMYHKNYCSSEKELETFGYGAQYCDPADIGIDVHLTQVRFVLSQQTNIACLSEYLIAKSQGFHCIDVGFNILIFPFIPSVPANVKISAFKY